MDKRLSIYDVVLIAKETVESQIDVQRLASALVDGLRKQEIAKVGRQAEYLNHELSNLIEGLPTGEGLLYSGHKVDDIVELATGVPRHNAIESRDRTYMKPRHGSDEPTY